MPTSPGSYAPLVTGNNTPMMSPLAGLPGTRNPFMAMLLQSAMMPAMGNAGMAPWAVQDRNVFTTMMQQRQWAESQQVLQGMSEAEQRQWMRTARGLAGAFGADWGRAREGAEALGGVIGTIAPIASQMAPGFWDAAMGERGSPTVMASRMFQGSRYAMDPVTGRMGMDPGAARAMSQQLFTQMFERDDISDMRGLSAGDVGAMYRELQHRGMIQGRPTRLAEMAAEAIDPRELQTIAADVGVDLPERLDDLTADQLSKLTSDTRIRDRMQAINVERVKQSLSEYTDAIAAVRDIFGDQGQPDAPMQQILAGLERLTLGSRARISGQQLDNIVRTTYELSNITGISMENAMRMQEHAASRAQRMGIDPVFGIQAAQGAMAFRASMPTGISEWGRFNADQMTQMDLNLRANAANSRQANQMNALLRLRDARGGFDEGSSAEAFAAAIEQGFTEFRDPETGDMRSVRMSETEFRDMLGRSGVSDTITSRILSQRFANREFGAEAGTAEVTRRLQIGDFRDSMRSAMEAQLAGILAGSDMDRSRAGELSTAIEESISQLSPEESADNEAVRGAISSVLQDRLGVSEDQAGMMATTLRGGLDRWIRNDPGRAPFESLTNAMTLMNPEVLNAQRRVMAQADAQKELRKSLSDIGRGSLTRRMVAYIQGAGEDANLSEFAATLLGGVDEEEVQEALGGELDALSSQFANIQDAAADMANAETPEARREARSRLDETITGMVTAAEALETAGAEADMTLEEDIDSSQVYKMIKESVLQQKDGKKRWEEIEPKVRSFLPESDEDKEPKTDGEADTKTTDDGPLVLFDRDSGDSVVGSGEVSKPSDGGLNLNEPAAAAASGGRIEIRGKLTIDGDEAYIEGTTEGMYHTGG